MKKIIKIMVVIGLTCFSFFYMNKVVNLVKDKDPIMVGIEKNKNLYKKDPVNAVVDENEIRPGINGLEVDEDESYYRMKRYGNYYANILVFKEVSPAISINNQYDKYISGGNQSKKEVSVIFKVNDNADIYDALNALNKKDINATFFVDGVWLESNENMAISILLDHNEIMNGGYNQKYSNDLITWTNSLIKKINKTYQAKYCYSDNENKEVLDICASNKMQVIKSNILIKNNNLSDFKKKLENGSIIVIELNQQTNQVLYNAISYIYQKGYKIVKVSDLLDESR